MSGTIADWERQQALKDAGLGECDVFIGAEGSIWLFTPVSARAKEFFAEYVGDDETQYWGAATVVEHRYVNDLVDGLLDEGFVLR